MVRNDFAFYGRSTSVFGAVFPLICTFPIMILFGSKGVGISLRKSNFHTCTLLPKQKESLGDCDIIFFFSFTTLSFISVIIQCPRNDGFISFEQKTTKN